MVVESCAFVRGLNLSTSVRFWFPKVTDPKLKDICENGDINVETLFNSIIG